jgi:hypothetical protein
MALRPAIKPTATPRPMSARPTRECHHSVGKREQKRSGGGNKEQGAVNEARPVAVEQHAAGKLYGGEHEEVHGRKHAEVRRAEAQLGDEVAGDERVDATEQVGEIVAGCEGQQDADGEMDTGGLGHWRVILAKWGHRRSTGPLLAAVQRSIRGRRSDGGLGLQEVQPSSFRSRRQISRALPLPGSSIRAPKIGCGRAGSSSLMLK